MQAHTQAEFKASINEGIVTADSKEGGGWLPLTCKSNGNGKVVYHIDDNPRRGKTRKIIHQRHNFETEPWSRHVVQMHGETSPFLVVECACLKDRHRARLLLAPVEGIDFPCRSRTFVRSLGYVGSFLREYGSAADLLDSLKKGRRNALLETVCAPGQRASAGHAQRGSFVPSSAVGNLDTSHVPLNETQREAVMRLTGGLDIIVGPPGELDILELKSTRRRRASETVMMIVVSCREQIFRCCV